jgi:CelD/BcsL family acetyltransferase involved in cellulose biosynthesis
VAALATPLARLGSTPAGVPQTVAFASKSEAPCYARLVIVANVETEPACPDELLSPSAAPAGTSRLRAERRPFESVDRADWDRLAAANPMATPFSSWAFHRAWWDAYGANAHEETLAIVEAGGATDGRLVAIAPLMHRHQVEPGDAATHTTLRHGHAPDLTAVAPTAKTIFFGASYHADYATILGDPDRAPEIAEALAAALSPDATPRDVDHPQPWDAIDLRRLRCGDAFADALAAAFGRREMDHDWTLNVEREDVCPVVTLPSEGGWDEYLGTLEKKARHEIRRKLRRAEESGPVVLSDSPDPASDLAAFIELHQKRWGADGLFPKTSGGDQSQIFFWRLFELFGAEGSEQSPLRMTFLTVGDRRIAAGIHFETADGYLYYNAGIDPDARDLSPGVVTTARYLQRALAAGKRRLDFLRGDEGYKYDWGAVDEPIQRILVRCPDVSGSVSPTSA